MRYPLKFILRLIRRAAPLAVFILAFQIRAADTSPEEIRARLDELEEKRSTTPEQALPWSEDDRPDLVTSNPRMVTVVVQSESVRMGAVWTFSNTADPSVRSVRVCLGTKGNEKFELPPGDYEVTLRVGYADGYSKTMGPLAVRLRAGRECHSVFDARMEDTIYREMKRAGLTERPPEEMSAKGSSYKRGLSNQSPADADRKGSLDSPRSPGRPKTPFRNRPKFGK